MAWYRFIAVVSALLLSLTGVSAKRSILLIPMDDRASSCQFPQKLGDIGEVTVVTPPKEILGRFLVAGDSERIIDWIKSQNLQTFDAAVISLDMLAYGGLAASREYETSAEDALERIHVLEYIRRAAPQMKIYAHSIIMRLALTFKAENEDFYLKFLDWATLAAEDGAESKAKLAELTKGIPPAVIDRYMAARKRNLQGNLLAIELSRKGIIDYLVLSQDDATPTGLHVPDRKQMLSKIEEYNLEANVVVQAGADEISMLLVTRSLQELVGRKVKIKVDYGLEDKRDELMPFEDRPLKNTVGHHIETSGGVEVDNEQDADLVLCIFASRGNDTLTSAFVDAVERKLRAGSRVIVADIDHTGRMQGGDPALTDELLRRGLFQQLYGYASWNTAANTLGTAIPQGIIYFISKSDARLWEAKGNSIQQAEDWFTIHRLLDDYFYHTAIRSRYKELIPLRFGWAEHLNKEARKKAEDYAMQQLKTQVPLILDGYITGSRGARRYAIQNLTFDLTWDRAFEAMIDFDLIPLDGN